MSSPQPTIVIRMGAEHNHIEIDGYTFDLNALQHRQRTFIRKTVVSALEKVGYFNER